MFSLATSSTTVNPPIGPTASADITASRKNTFRPSQSRTRSSAVDFLATMAFNHDGAHQGLMNYNSPDNTNVDLAEFNYPTGFGYPTLRSVEFAQPQHDIQERHSSMVGTPATNYGMMHPQPQPLPMRPPPPGYRNSNNNSESPMKVEDDDADEGSEYEEATDGKRKRKLNKNGQPRKARKPREALRKWNENDCLNALVGIVWSCGEMGVQIPFEQAAQLVGPGCTAGALQQAILKLHAKLNADGRQLPRLKMNWPKKGAYKSSGAARDPSKLPRRKPTMRQANQCMVITLKIDAKKLAEATAGNTAEATGAHLSSEASLVKDESTFLREETTLTQEEMELTQDETDPTQEEMDPAQEDMDPIQDVTSLAQNNLQLPHNGMRTGMALDLGPPGAVNYTRSTNLPLPPMGTRTPPGQFATLIQDGVEWEFRYPWGGPADPAFDEPRERQRFELTNDPGSPTMVHSAPLDDIFGGPVGNGYSSTYQPQPHNASWDAFEERYHCQVNSILEEDSNRDMQLSFMQQMNEALGR